MKWSLITFTFVVCATGLVRADDLKDGSAAMEAGQWDAAIKAFESYLAVTQTGPDVENVRVLLGNAYLHQGDFAKAISSLAPETDKAIKAEYRGEALYFTGLAQFLQGQKLAGTDKAGSDKAFQDAITTFNGMVDFINANPNPDNQALLEDVVYYRALAQYTVTNFTAAETDLELLLKNFPSSTKQADYLLLLAGIYELDMNKAQIAASDPSNPNKKTPDEIKGLAQKAMDIYDKISQDPNSLVQANDANMRMGDLQLHVAQLEPTNPAGFQKALDIFRRVRSKADIIELQQSRLDELKKAAQANLANGLNVNSSISRLIEGEQRRLDELKGGANPVIQALISMAQCYRNLNKPDEARTILRRLSTYMKASKDEKLTPDQQKSVDYETVYSYIVGGQTDKAILGQNAYLTKYPLDPQADSMSYLIAVELNKKKDYDGAMTQIQRSLKDYPKGNSLTQVLLLEAQVLTSQGKKDEAAKVLDEATKGGGSYGNTILLIKAKGELDNGDPTSALADFQKVLDDKTATPEFQFNAYAGQIEALTALGKKDDLFTATTALATKFPDNKQVPNVLLHSGVALDRSADPRGLTMLQDLVKKYPQDQVIAPFALNYIVAIEQRKGDVPAMLQAAKDLQTGYPTAYPQLSSTADAVSKEYAKEKKYDLAADAYQGLTDMPNAAMAASIQMKIAKVWQTAAQQAGVYSTLTPEAQTNAQKYVASAEQAYVAILKKFPDQLEYVGQAFQGLIDLTKQLRAWGVLTDATMEDHLGKVGADLTSSDLQARLSLAKIGLVLVSKNEAQYPAALAKFKEVIGANPSLVLSRQESNWFGELLIAAGEYPKALDVYQKLLHSVDPKDQHALGDAYYGLGAVSFAQGDYSHAKDYFSKLTTLSGGASWHPHILDAQYDLAFINETSPLTADHTAAKAAYGQLIKTVQAPVALQAKAMLGYGRLLEKDGIVLVPATPGTSEFAVRYYTQPDIFFGTATADASAEGLYDAAQAYEKFSDTANAKKQYSRLISIYGTSAPAWVAKAKTALSALP